MRKVKIRSWESMEKEFGLDYEGDIDVCPSFTSEMRYLCGDVVELDDDNMIRVTPHRTYRRISDDMIEKEPELKEKSIEDFPLVEVSYYAEGPWHESRYIFTDSYGWFLCEDSGDTSECYQYMRQIKPVDISELKKAAGLV